MDSSQSQEERLIESSFLFHFSVPCHQVKSRWKKNGLLLPDQYTLPCFDQLNNLPAKEKQSWADVRLGWNMDGLILNLLFVLLQSLLTSDYISRITFF